MEQDNTPYYQRVIGGKLSDQLSDPVFQQDLVNFFQSRRYGYSKEDILAKGPEGLYEDFAEHMRYQSSNTITASKDMFFANDETNTKEEERVAFGRLMYAWDNSEGEDMSMTKAWDYVEANLTDPLTIGSVLFTAGTGAGAAKGASLGAAQAVRMAARRAAATALGKESLKQSFVRGAVRAGAATALESAAFDVAGQIAREGVTKGYEFSPMSTAKAAVAGAVVGGVGGGIARSWQARNARKIDTVIEDGMAMRAAIAANGEANAKDTLKVTRKDVVDDITSKLSGLIDMAKSTTRARRAPLAGLPEDRVAAGDLLRRVITTGDAIDGIQLMGMDASTIRRAAGAYAEVAETLGVKFDGKTRISQYMADAFDSGQFTTDQFEEIIKKYGISRYAFSNMLLAEFSQAGKTLQTASRLKNRIFGRTVDAEADKALTDRLAEITASLGRLAGNKLNAVTKSPDEIAAFADDIAKRNNPALEFLRGFDQLRISMMTSQPSTTVANLIFGGARIPVDIVDTVFKNVVTDVKNVATGKGPLRNPLRGALDIMKGMTFAADEVELLHTMGVRDIPDSMQLLLDDLMRLEGKTGANKTMAAIGSYANILNSTTDNIFKNATFYASINRQLIEADNPALGKNFMEFVSRFHTLEMLPDSIIQKAIDDSFRYTFQKSYIKENTMFAKAARGVINIHQQVPFVLSSVLPFPRFTANMLEFLHDYTPFLGIAGMVREKVSGAVVNKTMEERIARQLTGTALFATAYTWRKMQGPETKPTEYRDPQTGEIKELSRITGPFSTMLIIADAFMRTQMHEQGEDVVFPTLDKTVLDLVDASFSTTVLPNTTALSEILKSFSEGKISPALGDILANVVATFTYPLAGLNDAYGQINPRSAEKPYTRSIEGETFSLFGIMDAYAELTLKAMRFVPDVPFIKLAQSDAEGYDLALRSPFASGPVVEIDPFIKQMSAISRKVKRNDLQNEMVRLGIEEFDVYRTYREPNASLDYAMRWFLSSKVEDGGMDLAGRFEAFKQTDPSYDKLSPDVKRERLLNWLSDQLSYAREATVAGFENLVKTNPKAAVGYVRNLYTLTVKTQNTRVVDEAVQAQYGMSTKEYLEQAETPEDEIGRKLNVIDLIGKLEDITR